MRRLSYFLLVLLAAILFSQEAAQLRQLRLVGRPERSESEFVSASTRDANGRICSAIKVISDLEGFKYDSYNGVVKVDDQPGQDMVYLSPDERVLQIFHTGYEPLKLILSEIGISLEERRIWVVKVAGDKKVVEINIGIISNPAGAEIFIDGAARGTEKQQAVSVGSHELRLVKSGFQPVIQTIFVDEKNMLFEIPLKPQEDVNIQIDSDPQGATVYLDGVKLPGKTLINTFYPTGNYKIRLEMEWFVPYEDNINIQPGMSRETYKLQPDFATLTVNSAPQSALMIVLNNAPQNVSTPHIFDRLSPGPYRVRAKSEFYESDEIEVQLERGDKKTVALHSSASFATLTIKTHPGATVYLNNQKIEQMEAIRLEPTLVTVRAEMKKAIAAEQRLVLKKGDVQTIELFPQMPRGTIQIAAVPVEAKIELRGDADEFYSAIGAKSFSGIPAGAYALEVTCGDYLPHKETIILRENEKINKSVTLQKPAISVEIEKHTAGIELLLVKGGTFEMGDTFGDGDKDEKPVHSVTVSDFYLGKTEVTVGQFRQFVDATGYRTDAEKEGWAYAWTGSAWGKVDGAGWKKPGFSQDDGHPVVCVSWNDATAFCRWAGYRLPTEAEWEYAAREGGKKIKYSWGNDNPAGRLGGNVADESAKRQFSNWTIFSGYDDGYVFTAPTGSFAANALSLYDMSGNVLEWCLDWYGADYYGKSPRENPQGPSSGTYRVLRGGSWVSYPSICRAAVRDRFDPDNRFSGCGFRVVRPVQ